MPLNSERIELMNKLIGVKKSISAIWHISQTHGFTQEKQDQIGNCLCQLDEAIGAIETELEKASKEAGF